MFKKLTIFFFMILLCGCTYGNAEENNESPAEETALPVETETVTTETVETTTNITGTVIAKNQSAVVPVASGTVTSVEVSNGDTVEKGDPLVRLDATDAELNVAQAQASVDAAQANLKSAQAARNSAIQQAEQQLEQARSAYDFANQAHESANSTNEGAQPDLPADLSEELQEVVGILLQQNQPQPDEASLQFELEQAEQNVQAAEQALEAAKSTDQIEAAEASVEQAEVSLEMAQRQANQLVIQAPRSGQVSNLMVNEGELASPQAPLMNIVQLDPLVVSANVSADQLADITEGQEVDVEIKATQDSLQGQVAYISSIPGEESRKYPIEIEFEETPDHLHPGMVAQLVLSEASEEERIVIPIDAVVKYEGQQFVFVIEDDRVRQREVSTGLELDQQVVIESGLSANEEIVTNGQFQLSDGDLIEVQNERMDETRTDETTDESNEETQNESNDEKQTQSEES